MKVQITVTKARMLFSKNNKILINCFRNKIVLHYIFPAKVQNLSFKFIVCCVLRNNHATCNFVSYQHAIVVDVRFQFNEGKNWN